MFDLSITKIAVLLVLAVVIFGPEQLPKLAQQAGRALRDLRRLADNATADLKEGLGPEFADFDVTDLHPKNFVRKHLWEDFDGDHGNGTAGQMTEATPFPDTDSLTRLAPGESPPYDSEAT